MFWIATLRPMGLKSNAILYVCFRVNFWGSKKTAKSAWNTPVYQVALARPECDSLCVLCKKEFFSSANGAVSSFDNPALNPHSLYSPSLVYFFGNYTTLLPMGSSLIFLVMIKSFFLVEFFHGGVWPQSIGFWGGFFPQTKTTKTSKMKKIQKERHKSASKNP